MTKSEVEITSATSADLENIKWTRRHRGGSKRHEFEIDIQYDKANKAMSNGLGVAMVAGDWDSVEKTVSRLRRKADEEGLTLQIAQVESEEKHIVAVRKIQFPDNFIESEDL